MNKRIKILSVILSSIIVALAFMGCTPAGAPEHSTANPQYAVSAENLADKLDDFITTVGDDRTSFTQAEENAAKYIGARLTEYGYSDVVLQDFTATEKGEEVKSQNVIAYYRTENRTADTKNVVIGAYYDNRYKSAYKGAAVYKSQGALANGTGVTTLLAIAEYFQIEKPKFDFDVTVVFFGGSFVTDVGGREFYKSGMSHRERANTVLMVELQRLGVDHVYAYSDARQTKREPFFDGVAADYGLDVYKITQKSPLVTDATAYDGIPYYQWAHSGVFGVFFDAGIPTLNLIGANWETVNMTDTESSEHANIAYTDRDNLDTLKRLHPQYAQKMATAATLVIGALSDERFLTVMSYDRANFPNTDVLTKSWIWHLVVLGAVIIFAAVTFAVSSHIGKKYPVVAPAPKRMKMAVFGMDYEDTDSSDIFIDIKNASPQDDIFPGVPNNDTPVLTVNPFDDVFSSVFAAPSGKRDSDNDDVFATGDSKLGEATDVAMTERDKADTSAEYNAAEPFDELSSENTDSEKIAGENNGENVQKDSADGIGDNSISAENRTESQKPRKSATGGSAPRKTAPRKTTAESTAKRRTVSAGKSIGAQAGRKGKTSDKSGTDESAKDGE